MLKTTAEYHDGKSSGAMQVELVLHDDASVSIKGESISRLYRLSDISISPRLGNIPRVLTLPDRASCHVADNNLIDTYLKTCRQTDASALLHLLESRLIYVLAAVVFTLLFSWVMVTHGVPYFAKQIAFSLPLEVDRTLGQGTLEAMDKMVFSTSSTEAEVQQRLRERFAQMKQQIDGAQAYQLLFRHGNQIGVNAFALPSGIVVVTDELVALSESDDEIIAVLTHEMGHLVYRHSVRMALQSSAIAVLVATITGDPFSTSSLVVALPTILANSKYSREFENEADDYAYDYLHANQISLQAFASILEKISGPESTSESESSTGIENYLSSHPATRDRTGRFK